MTRARAVVVFAVVLLAMGGALYLMRPSEDLKADAVNVGPDKGGQMSTGTNEEAFLAEAIELGLIEKPTDPVAFLEKVKAGTDTAEQWVEAVTKLPSVKTHQPDGTPSIEVLYPIAVKLCALGTMVPGLKDAEQVAELLRFVNQLAPRAARHFESYHRAGPGFPKDKSGKTDWFTLYLTMNNHFSQCAQGKIAAVPVE